MYDPGLTAEAQDRLFAAFGRPTGWVEDSAKDARALTARIVQKWDPEVGGLTQSLTPEESEFVARARLRVTYDARFYLSTFVWIDEEGHGLRPLVPLWDSQRWLLDKLSAIERKNHRDGNPDGILLNVLKVRQVGISTLGMGLVSQRIFTQPYLRAIAGSDTEEQARYLFRMIERIYEHLPWFLQSPKIVPYAAGRELNLSNKSSIKTAWGKTTRGALQEQGGKKGNIERGRTNSVVHISELATWDYPEQLDTSLLPGIPVNEKTLVIFESTAETAGDWWHRHYLAAQEGEGRFQNLFIPWPVKYQLEAPEGWTPNDETLHVAAQIERDSPQWGEQLRLTRNHLYWYESTRGYYAAKNQLHDFFKEYPSNPEECFQYAGRSIFSLEELTRIDHAARPILDVWAVEPARDIAELKRLPASTGDPAADLRAAGLRADLRRPAPIAPRLPAAVGNQHPVPPGFGFRRLSKEELADLPSVRQSVLTLYEYPRLRGSARYILAIDVGDGLGQDYSVITVVREPTIEEVAEEVAQYVTNTLKPSSLAFVADAIGRYYCDRDGTEALCAVELNNHGVTVQDLLQLHLGYTNFFVWEVVDAADPSSRFTKRIGWQTTTRTRPILLEKFHDAVTAIDPVSGYADFRLNSPVTRGELRHFVTEGLLGEAEHARGQHDDAIFSSAIAYYVAYRQAGGEAEPVSERRRRRAQLLNLAAQGRRPDYRNSPLTAEESDHAHDPDLDEFDPDADLGGVSYFDDRNRA